MRDTVSLLEFHRLFDTDEKYSKRIMIPDIKQGLPGTLRENETLADLMKRNGSSYYIPVQTIKLHAVYFML